MRNASLRSILEAFTADAAAQLAAETAQGAEVPFEVVEEPGPGTPLYCYRPLTDSFIRARLGLLARLTTYAPAVRALAALEGLDAYLLRLADPRIAPEQRERAEGALRAFLSRVFADRSEFSYNGARFETAYAELEGAVYEGRCVTSVIAPLLGVALDHRTAELALGGGLSLVRGEARPDAPADAVWAEREEPNVLAHLTLTHESPTQSPLPVARARFRRLLTALRLFERGGFALGPLAWARADAGLWRPVPLGGSGRVRSITFVSADQEDEFRAFCNLVAGDCRPAVRSRGRWPASRWETTGWRPTRRSPTTSSRSGPCSSRRVRRAGGWLAGSPRSAPLRTSGPCVAERTAHAVALEDAVISGTALAHPVADGRVDEIAEHLRAILRDVLCGHLAPDLRVVADELLRAAAAVAA